uniref:PPM-type phosphatase domain-containing protein n=1 Tax=Cannabis sativa TaxID=3483 RepID=A0A803P4L1_CANSA
MTSKPHKSKTCQDPNVTFEAELIELKVLYKILNWECPTPLEIEYHYSVKAIPVRKNVVGGFYYLGTHFNKHKIIIGLPNKTPFKEDFFWTTSVSPIGTTTFRIIPVLKRPTPNPMMGERNRLMLGLHYCLRSIEFLLNEVNLRTTRLRRTTFTMQSLRKPKKEHLEGFEKGNRGVRLRAWDKIFLPKSRGGLRFCKTKDMNLAFLAKWEWNLLFGYQHQEGSMGDPWVVLAPMTRCRALNEIHGPTLAEYYTQRSTQGTTFHSMAKSLHRKDHCFSPYNMANFSLSHRVCSCDDCLGESGPKSVTFYSLGHGPYTGVTDGRILFWNGHSWTDFAYTSPNRVLTLDEIEGLKNLDVQCWGTVEGDEGDPPRLWIPNGMYLGTAFTRSIGDFIAESIGVVATLEIVVLELTQDNPFFVLASDGVFDFLSSQTVVDMVAKYKDPRDACAAIVAESYRLWLQYKTRTDDITIIVVHIDGLAETGGGQTLSSAAVLRPPVPQVVEVTGS